RPSPSPGVYGEERALPSQGLSAESGGPQAGALPPSPGAGAPRAPRPGRRRVGCDADAPTHDRPDRPEVAQASHRPQGDHGHAEEQVGPDVRLMRARLGVIAVRPISADPEREVTEEVMQVLSRARREGGLQALGEL